MLQQDNLCKNFDLVEGKRYIFAVYLESLYYMRDRKGLIRVR